MSALLEVQNLEKQFPIAGSRKVVQAVNGVDFTIESGKTLAPSSIPLGRSTQGGGATSTQERSIGRPG